MYDVIKLKGNKPNKIGAKECKKLNTKVVGTIRQWVDGTVFHQVANEIDTHNLWTKLEALYQPKTTQNKAFLIRRLVKLTLTSKHTIAENLSDFQDIVNQLSTLELVLGEEL